MRFVIWTTILICVGVFLWPLILTSGRRLSSQLSQLWRATEIEEDGSLEMDNTVPPPTIDSPWNNPDSEPKVYKGSSKHSAKWQDQ